MLPGQQDEPGEVTDPAFARALLGHLVGGTRTSNQLPPSDDYAAAFPAYNGSMAGMGSRLNGMMQGFMDQHQVPGAAGAAVDDVSARFDSVVELSDRLLDRVDHDLARQEAMQLAAEQQRTFGHGAGGGAGLLQQTPGRHAVPAAATALPGSGSGAVPTMSATNKPQHRWRDEVDNSSRPFVPKLRLKPNAIVPLELRLEQPDEAVCDLSPLSALGTAASSARPQPAAWYANPYSPEISAFMPTDEQLGSGREMLYHPLHVTPVTWVDNEAALQQMRVRLAAVSEFAIDLECHSHRSYRGFVCLMQISTRDEDFLVDTIELRASLHVLNDVFTDPRVAKVMHGADSDVIWLQRDFGLYVVGLFDTGQAMRVLEFQSFALAHLLKHYCGVTANKALQMADWRLRPLTEEMATYAREETHYLLYIYDRLKSDLAPSGRCLAVFQRSSELCRQAYKTPQFDPEGHITLARRQNVQLGAPQMGVLRALFAWRDAIAREEDESTAFVLPNHQLFRLASGAPQTPEQLHAVCHPLPPLLHYKATSLLTTIRSALAEATPASSASTAAECAHPQALPAGARAAAAPAPCGAGGAAPCQVMSAAVTGMMAPMHPMQPSLLAPPAAFGAMPVEGPRLGVCPSTMQAAAGGGPVAAAAASAAAGRGSATQSASRSVRCPPAPTRSPPLPPEHVYGAAGWVASGPEELTKALLPGGRGGAAALSESENGAFVEWSEGSSDDGEEGGAESPFEAGEDARTARSVQQQLNASPLWVLSMFAPGADAVVAGTSAVAGGGRVGEPAVPRSLTEIYKLSNQNKRRGAAGRRPSEEVPPELEEAKVGEAESSSDGGGDVDPGADDDEADDDDDDGSKRRRGTEGGDGWVAEASKHDTEDFMRRIGWLRPDAEMPTGSEPMAEPQRGGGGGIPRRGAEGSEYGGSDPPPLPFQRQLPPHMPVRPGAASSGATSRAPGASMLPMPQQPSGALAQLLAAPRQQGQPSSGAPGHSSLMPPLPTSQDVPQMETKKPRARSHKKRPGFGGEGGFDYEAASAASPFVYSMGGGQGGGGGKGDGGKGGGKGGVGKGGDKRGPPPSSGNRSMSFAPSGPPHGRGGGGVRRY